LLTNLLWKMLPAEPSTMVRSPSEALSRTWLTKNTVLLIALAMIAAIPLWQLSLLSGALTRPGTRQLTGLSNISSPMNESKQFFRENRHARRICVTMDSTVIGRRHLFVLVWARATLMAGFRNMIAGQVSCIEPDFGPFYRENTPLYCEFISAAQADQGLRLCSSNGRLGNVNTRRLFQYNPNSNFQANYICDVNDCRELSRQLIE